MSGLLRELFRTSYTNTMHNRCSYASANVCDTTKGFRKTQMFIVEKHFSEIRNAPAK